MACMVKKHMSVSLDIPKKQATCYEDKGSGKT